MRKKSGRVNRSRLTVYLFEGNADAPVFEVIPSGFKIVGNVQTVREGGILLVGLEDENYYMWNDKGFLKLINRKVEAAIKFKNEMQ